MTQDPDRLVRLEVVDAIASVTLDSQHNRNALSRRLVAELAECLDEADRAPARAIVLRHEGPAFCAGADLKERADDGRPNDSSAMVGVMRQLMESERPTIAAVEGAVRAGGIGLMASCDLVVVHSDVSFALTEVRIGVAPAIISVPILRRVPPSKIAAAMLTGEAFSARDAREMGLVTRVDDDVPAAVGALCEGIRAGSPRAVAETKSLLRRVPAMERDEAFDDMSVLSERLFRGDDAREGMAAFRERRSPVWPE